MSPRVVVLYKGLKVVEVLWEDRRSLERKDVLAVAIKRANDPRERRQHVYGYDFYVLAWRDDGFYFLGGFDDDFRWFSLTEPHKPYGEGWVFQFPYAMQDDSMLFESAKLLSADEWTDAVAIIDDPRGPMRQWRS